MTPSKRRLLAFGVILASVPLAVWAGTVGTGTISVGAPPIYSTGVMAPGTCIVLVTSGGTQVGKICGTAANTWQFQDTSGNVLFGFQKGSSTGDVNYTDKDGSYFFRSNYLASTLQSQYDFQLISGSSGTIAYNGSGPLTLKGSAAATGDTAIKFDNFTTQTSGKLASFLNHGTEKTSMNFAGGLTFSATDSSGTPGAATIDKPSGQVAIAATAASVTVTDALVSSTSIVHATIQATDATCTFIKSVAPGSGSFVITANAACTGNTKVGFTVFN